MTDETGKPRRVLNRSTVKVPMREQPPGERIYNFEEVPLGYTPEEAVQEAQRCLLCRDKPCVQGCPVGVDIPAFQQLVMAGDFEGALRKIKEMNFLPAICGRVCPQEDQCEVGLPCSPKRASRAAWGGSSASWATTPSRTTSTSPRTSPRRPAKRWRSSAPGRPA